MGISRLSLAAIIGPFQQRNLETQKVPTMLKRYSSVWKLETRRFFHMRYGTAQRAIDRVMHAKRLFIAIITTASVFTIISSHRQNFWSGVHLDSGGRSEILGNGTDLIFIPPQIRSK